MDKIIKADVVTLLILLILLFIVIVIVIVALTNLNGKFKQLQEQVLALQKKLERVQTAKAAKPTSIPVTGKTDSTNQAPETIPRQDSAAPTKTDETPEDLPQPISQPVVTFSATSTITAVKPQQPPTVVDKEQPAKVAPKNPERTLEDSYLSKFWHWLVKENPVAKLAIIILFFGVSYLLKYSIDHALLSPEIRILGSLGIGFALLGFGWKLRQKKTLYALLLQGGAIGILYLTIFAAIKLYALIPILMAFVLLVIICVTSVMFAVLQRALSLAIIACVGGYLAPILLSTGSGNHIALFSYYLMISIGILFISRWQSWRILNLIGFFFTFIVAIIWGNNSYQPQFYPECQLFIISNLAIYGVLAVILSIRSEKTEQYQHIIDLILLFGAPLSGFSLQYHISNQWEFGPAFSSLGFGLFYLVGAYFILKKWQQFAKRTALYGMAIGLGFSTLAIPLAFSAQWTSLIWLLEGTALTWATLSQRQYRSSLFGVLIILLGFIAAHISGLNAMSDPAFITLYGVMSALLLFNTCLWYHYRTQTLFASYIYSILIILAIITWVIWIIGSVTRLMDNNDYIVQPIVLCFVIAVWIWHFIGKKQNWVTLQYSVTALWPILFLSILESILFYKHTYYAGIWGLSWLIAFASAYVYLYSARNQLKLTPYLPAILHISLFWFVLVWLSNEISWAISYLPWGFTVVKWAITMSIAALIILVLFYVQRLRVFAQSNLNRIYWLVGLIPVVLFILFKLFTGWASNTQIIYWPYIPLINPLEESAIFGWMMLALWVNQVRKIVTNNADENTQLLLTQGAPLVLILLTFLWGNGLLLRLMSSILNLTWSFHALWSSNIVQVVLSLVWTFVALILVIIANRYTIRKVWYAGAVLQAIVVIKLIFVDSVELDGLFRAFVFIGVAILMLIIGYLAPLPPKIVKTAPLVTESNKETE